MCADLGVLEGFICPICFQDLGSLYNLTDHFELTHNSEEDKALLNQIKGIFGKAKKKLLKKDDYFDPSNSISNTSSVKSGAVTKKLKELLIFDPQELGVTRSHTDFFKSYRERRIDRFVIETNKLLIRLDKLINIDASLDSNKRKTLEKSIVSWASDKDVNICMTCGQPFKLTRRRHHCRLCGRIICHKCSNFLPYDFAKKLTNPSVAYEGEGFHRSSSTSSLNSTVSAEGSLHLRACQECRFLLERRQEQINLQTSKPTIVLLYEKLKDFITEAEELLPEYIKMANSLSCGETAYELQDAHNVRDKLMKCCEYITLYLKRIVSDNTNKDSNNQLDSTPKQLRLQQMISVYATSFVQDNLLGLPKLPTDSELSKLRETRKIQAQMRIAEERKMQQERMKRLEEEQLQQQLQQQQQQQRQAISSDNSSKGHRRSKSSEGLSAVYRTNRPSSPSTTHASAWIPKAGTQQEHDDSITFLSTTKTKISSTHPINKCETIDGSGKRIDEDDNDIHPILQQIQIIKGYLAQAKNDGCWDEVRMLRDNLIDLNEEYEKIIKETNH